MLSVSRRFLCLKSAARGALLGLSLLWSGSAARATTSLQLTVCAEAAHQDLPLAASDGAGGSIVAWTDHRGGNGADIYAQRIDAAGAALWSPGGAAVCAAAGSQHLTGIVADGAGGAVFTWIDHRSADETGEDIYVQRLDAGGSAAWGADGAPACRAPGTQAEAAAVSDEAGGVIVVWTDSRNGVGSGDIRGQRVGAAGAPLWDADGVELAAARAGGRRAPALATDGAGGATVAWIEAGTGADEGQDAVRAQRINGDGDRVWPASDVEIASGTAVGGAPSLISDGAGGSLAAWPESPAEDGISRVRAQHLSSSGTLQWADGGAVAAAGPGALHLAGAAAGLTGDFYVAWAEDTTTGSRQGRVQRLDAAGAPLWAAAGVAFSPAAENDVTGIKALGDGEGGVMLAWQQRRTAASPDIMAARLSAAGDAMWDAPLAVAATQSEEFSPAAVVAEPGRMAAFWYAHESGDHNIYGRILPDAP